VTVQSVQRLGYGLDDQDSIPGWADFSLRHCFQTGSGVHTTSYPKGTQLLSSAGKQLKHETDNVWSYTSTSRYGYMACVYLSTRDIFILLYIQRQVTQQVYRHQNLKYISLKNKKS
jgi:hypothetical protein